MVTPYRGAMRLVFLIALLAACGDNYLLPDAAPIPGMHDLVTGCDPKWSADHHAPAFCELACATRPIEITPCPKGDAACYDQPHCAAWTPSAPAAECHATFILGGTRGVDAGPGDVLGCCVVRRVFGDDVPTFYTCL